MAHTYYLSTLKLANRIFRVLAGVSLFLAVFITPPLLRVLHYHLIFGTVELCLVAIALFLVPVFFAVMAFLARKLDEDIFRHYARPRTAEQGT